MTRVENLLALVAALDRQLDRLAVGKPPSSNTAAAIRRHREIEANLSRKVAS